MSFFTNKVKRWELMPGDHIYSYRTAYIYAHHGIYIGNNQVINFTGTSSSSFSSSFSSFSSHRRCLTPHCGFKTPNNDVVLTCLDCFQKSGSLYRFQYGVSEFVFETRLRRGTCTMVASQLPGMVVNRAMYLLTNTGFGKYHLLENNCEGFAYYCKTELLLVKRSPSQFLRSDLVVGISGQISRTMSNFDQRFFHIIRVPVQNLWSIRR